MENYIQPEETMNSQREVIEGRNATETGKERILLLCQNKTYFENDNVKRQHLVI